LDGPLHRSRLVISSQRHFVLTASFPVAGSQSDRLPDTLLLLCKHCNAENPSDLSTHMAWHGKVKKVVCSRATLGTLQQPQMNACRWPATVAQLRTTGHTYAGACVVSSKRALLLSCKFRRGPNDVGLTLDSAILWHMQFSFFVSLPSPMGNA